MPPKSLDAQEILTWLSILVIVGPALTWGIIFLLNRYFVSHDKFGKHADQVATVHKEHLEMISTLKNENVQSNLKSHELLGGIKGLTSAVQELRQDLRNNSEKTQDLTTKVAVLADRDDR